MKHVTIFVFTLVFVCLLNNAYGEENDLQNKQKLYYRCKLF